MSMNEKVRAEFEAEAVKFSDVIEFKRDVARGRPDCYVDFTAQCAWEFWQAAHSRYAGGGEAEPIGWTWRSYCGVQFTSMPNLAGVLQSTGAKLTPVYTHPQSPAVVDRAALIELLAAISRQSEGVTADLIIDMLTASGKGE